MNRLSYLVRLLTSRFSCPKQAVEQNLVMGDIIVKHTVPDLSDRAVVYCYT